jgi:crossover junction endodeoxyribonuclease RuvC
MRRVCLGIDPGLGRLGYGVVIEEKSVMRAGEFGCIATEPRTPVEARILQIHERLCPLIERSGPELLSVERLFFGRNTTTAENVFQIRGVVLLLAARYSIPLVQPKPSEVKLAVCGNGRAEKNGFSAPATGEPSLPGRCRRRPCHSAHRPSVVGFPDEDEKW